jgi:hypothetical protein
MEIKFPERLTDKTKSTKRLTSKMIGQKRTSIEAGLSPLNPNNINISNNSINSNIIQNMTPPDQFLDQLSKLKESCGDEIKPLIPFLHMMYVQQQQFLASIQQQFAVIHNNTNNNAITAEELERQRSIVVIGLPEEDHQKPSQLMAADKAIVTDLLDQMGIEAQPVIYRLGPKTNPSRKGPRLLKMILPSRSFQRRLLGQWGKNREDIKKQVGLERLLIRPSLTPQQREEERKVWEQKKKRKEHQQHGEHQQHDEHPQTEQTPAPNNIPSLFATQPSLLAPHFHQ